jgi:MFS family permease
MRRLNQERNLTFLDARSASVISRLYIGAGAAVYSADMAHEKAALPGARPRPVLLALPGPVYVLFAARLVNAAGNFVQPYLTMILTRKLGWSSSLAGAFITAANVAGLLLGLAAGKVADRLGRRILIALCQLGACALSLAGAMVGASPALPWLMAASMMLLSVTWPAFNASVADLTRPEQRKEAFSLLYWGNNIGFALGPLAAGYLFERHLRAMFLGNAAALAAVSCLFIFAMRETRPASRSGAEPVALPATGGGSPDPEAEAGGGVIKALLARPLVLAYALVTALITFVYQQFSFGIPIRLGNLFGERGAEVFGKLMAVNAITVVALTLPLSRLLRRVRPLACVSLAGLFYAAGFGSYALARGEWAIYGLTALWTLGEIIAAINTGVFVASRSPRSHRGRFNALVNLVSSSGGMLCPLLSGPFIQAYGDRAIWVLAGGLALAASALMASLAYRDRAA